MIIEIYIVFGLKNEEEKIRCLNFILKCEGWDLNPGTTKDKALNLAPLTKLDYPRISTCMFYFLPFKFPHYSQIL